jgi:hypothetical protein
MSNPLLKPGDPRFAQPSIVDAAGQNRFAETENGSASDAPPAPSSQPDIYSASPASSEAPYQPRYETTAQSRGIILLVLALVGLGGAAAGMTSLTGIMLTGWIFPLCAFFAAGSAWLLAFGDLREMQTGARDDEGRPLTQIAMWLGVVGLIACVGSVASMVWLGLSLLPSFL